MFLKTMANMKIIHILEDPTVNLSVVLPSFCIAYSVSLTALHVMNTTYHCPSYDLLLSKALAISFLNLFIKWLISVKSTFRFFFRCVVVWAHMFNNQHVWCSSSLRVCKKHLIIVRTLKVITLINKLCYFTKLLSKMNGSLC